MKYNFDELINRQGTNSYKWDSATDKDIIPMWVADMDFRTAPVIVETLKKRVEHGIFGYTKVPDTYYDTVVNWFAQKHNWHFSKEWILYTSGVVPAISVIVKALTVPGNQVIVQTPVYNCFFSSIRNNGCEIVSNSLIYENHTYHINFEDLEKKAADPKAKILLLCNPHNPAGRVWSKEELTRIGDICIKNNVWIVSDEIHCEFVFPGYTYTPFASISKDFQHHAIICNAPSKAFNTAGLQIANIISDNEEVRKKIDKAININEVCDVNPFGVEALMAAYSKEGAEWLDELNAYLLKNYEYLIHFFKTNLPQFPVTILEGTYLVWVDCSILNQHSEQIMEYLLKEKKVWVNEGVMYGEDGNHFIRINIACPRQRLTMGLQRICEGLQQLLLF